MNRRILPNSSYTGWCSPLYVQPSLLVYVELTDLGLRDLANCREYGTMAVAEYRIERRV